MATENNNGQNDARDFEVELVRRHVENLPRGAPFVSFVLDGSYIFVKMKAPAFKNLIKKAVRSRRYRESDMIMKEMQGEMF